MASQAHKQRKIPVLTIGLGILLSLLIIAPLMALMLRAVYHDGQWTINEAIQVLNDPSHLETITNSLLLGLLVVLTSTVISLPLAYLFAKTKFANYRIFDIIFLIPFMTPPYIASMGWILFMQRRGLLQQMLPWTQGSEDWFFSLTGLVLVMSFNNFPFMVSLLRNALQNVPSSLEESGAILGASFGARLRKIVLPLISGNYAIAALLVFVRTISEYGAPATIGRRIGFEVFTTAIHRNATVAPISFGNAAILSVVLIIICLIMWLIQTYITKKNTYNLIGSRSNRMSLNKLSGVGKSFAWLYIIIIIIVSIGIPYFSVIVTSLIDVRGYGLQAGNFTLRHYAELFADNTRAVNAISNSFILATVTATICMLIGTLVVSTMYRVKSVLNKPLEFTSLIPQMLPGIVIVLGLMIFWNRYYSTLPIYNTMWMMLLTYVVLFIPYTINYVNSAYTQIGSNLVEAGKIYGASDFYIFRKIHFPLIFRSMMTGWVMTFIISLRELVASSMIAPPGEYVISTFIMREFEQGTVSTGMVMATITVLLTTLSLIALNWLMSRNDKG